MPENKYILGYKYRIIKSYSALIIRLVKLKRTNYARPNTQIQIFSAFD